MVVLLITSAMSFIVPDFLVLNFFYRSYNDDFFTELLDYFSQMIDTTESNHATSEDILLVDLSQLHMDWFGPSKTDSQERSTELCEVT